MRFPTPLIDGTWVRRYQRFLVDVQLDDGSITTAHCPNTGSMIGINRPGARVMLLDSNNPERKLRYTLQAVRVGRHWVGAHPIHANTIAKEAIEAGMLDVVPTVTQIRAEVPYGQSSRADLVLQTRTGQPWFVEVKSASLCDGRTSMFPDSVTQRGLKHLNELLDVVRGGGRALMLFVATRDDVDLFRPAAHIDAAYAKRLGQVAAKGVIVRAITSRTTRRAMTAARVIPVEL